MKSASLALIFTIVSAAILSAEKLPIKIYTVADGLGSSYIHQVYCDSRGFIWLNTRDGLNRFDGYQFVTYGKEHGLPDLAMYAITESHNGAYLVQTNGGQICRFYPQSKNRAEMFVVYSGVDVNRMTGGPSGNIWAGGNSLLLFNPHLNQFALVDSSAQVFPNSSVLITALLEDPHGSLWIGTSKGLFRRLPDGQIESHVFDSENNNHIYSLMFDSSSRLWVGSLTLGLYVYNPAPPDLAASDENIKHAITLTDSFAGDLPEIGAAHRITSRDGLVSDRINTMFQSSDGRIWIGTDKGLGEYNNGRLKNYTTQNGLCSDGIVSIAEDKHGNLWIGSMSGLMKMPLNGFVSFNESDGLGGPAVYAIFPGPHGNPMAIAYNWLIARFDGQRFTTMSAAMPLNASGIWASPLGVLDRRGHWWLLSDKGIYRLPAKLDWQPGARIQPEAVFTSRNGLASDNAFRLFEDSRSDIWISLRSGDSSSLTRWDRHTQQLKTFDENDGLPTANGASAFCEDKLGTRWFGFYRGGLARFKDDRFTYFDAADGVPQQFITELHLDQSKRLWLATNLDGLAYIEDVAAEQPTFVRYTTANGLSSNNVRCIAEDERGRIYAGTVRGVDRLDLQSGQVRQYTAADGLSGEFMYDAMRDTTGRLWFASPQGLSYFRPNEEQQSAAAPVYISGLRIAGNSHALSELGETRIDGVEIDADQNHLQIDFFTLSFEIGERLRYQYKLEGADDGWGIATENRTVHYARLAPGAYRFMVRAVSSSGLASPQPAEVSFSILPPFWRSWWFIACALFFVIGLAVFFERQRVRRLIEIEKVRARIATDLHDDIGSGLTHIGLLSEVTLRKFRARHQSESAAPPTKASVESEFVSDDLLGSVEHVGIIARELSAAMSDVVWSINPKHDSLDALVNRFSGFAHEMCKAKHIELRFTVSENIHRLKLNPETRRNVLLIAKEALNNMAKYSESPAVDVQIRIHENALEISVQDYGIGFDVSTPGHGNGLVNIRTRAQKIGGRSEINSEIGKGAQVRVVVPVS